MPKTGMHYRKRLELSDRQREVLRLMERGRTNFEIAQALGVTLDGAKYHVSEILAKLDVSTREEAVEVWRDYNRPGDRVRRMGAAIAGSVSALPAGVKVSAAAAVLVLAAIGTVVLWPQQDDEEVQAAPETAEELLETMAAVLGEDGQVLEVEALWTVEEEGSGAQEYGSFRAWFAFEEERGRIEYTKGPDNTTDTPESWTIWFDGGNYYEQMPDDDRPRSGSLQEQWERCLGMESLLAEVLACGLQDWPSNLETSNVRMLDGAEWEGRPAFGIAFDQVQDIQRVPGGNPRPTPSPTPGAGTPPAAGTPGTYRVLTAYEFLVDASSYLPLGLRARAEREGEFVGTYEVEYEARLIEGDNFDASVFDPWAGGFSTPVE